jgi:hypothetical protein
MLSFQAAGGEAWSNVHHLPAAAFQPVTFSKVIVKRLNIR